MTRRAKRFMEDRLSASAGENFAARQVDLVREQLAHMPFYGDLLDNVALVQPGSKAQVVHVTQLATTLIRAGVANLHPDTCDQIDRVRLTDGYLACIVIIDGWVGVVGMPCHVLSTGGVS